MNKYEISASEYCEVAPWEIRLDPEQFREVSEKVSKSLTDLDFDYAVQWYAGFNCELLDEEGVVIPVPFRHEAQLKVYQNGDFQLAWKHKDSVEELEFWAEIRLGERP